MCSGLTTSAAWDAASPSMWQRRSVSSSNSRADSAGTMTDRLARNSSAPSAINRCMASRAGITLAPIMVEMDFTVTTWPGLKCPFIKAVRTERVTCSRRVTFSTGFKAGKAPAASGCITRSFDKRCKIAQRGPRGFSSLININRAPDCAPHTR